MKDNRKKKCEQRGCDVWKAGICLFISEEKSNKKLAGTVSQLHFSQAISMQKGAKKIL